MLPGLSSCQPRSSTETHVAVTLQHSTLRGLIIPPFRVNGKTRPVLGSGCCFGAATQCRSPTGGLDTFSIWFSESSQSCPSTRTCSPFRASSGQSSWVRRDPAGSAATSPELPQPAGIVSACSCCLLALSSPRKVTSAVALSERLLIFWMTLQEWQLLTHLLFQ